MVVTVLVPVCVFIALVAAGSLGVGAICFIRKVRKYLSIYHISEMKTLLKIKRKRREEADYEFEEYGNEKDFHDNENDVS